MFPASTPEPASQLSVQQTLLQCGFAQRGFDYTCENKCAQLFPERGKFDYAQSTKHSVLAKDGLAFAFVKPVWFVLFAKCKV
jgi:hypothetical protein